MWVVLLGACHRLEWEARHTGCATDFSRSVGHAQIISVSGLSITKCVYIVMQIDNVMKCIIAVTLLLALFGTASAIAPVTNATGGWRQGRATFYGGSETYLSNFPDRY